MSRTEHTVVATSCAAHDEASTEHDRAGFIDCRAGWDHSGDGTGGRWRTLWSGDGKGADDGATERYFKQLRCSLSFTIANVESSRHAKLHAQTKRIQTTLSYRPPTNRIAAQPHQPTLATLATSANDRHFFCKFKLQKSALARQALKIGRHGAPLYHTAATDSAEPKIKRSARDSSGKAADTSQ